MKNKNKIDQRKALNKNLKIFFTRHYKRNDIEAKPARKRNK